jgi:5,10-methylenetetrahydromethanopterin reductase
VRALREAIELIREMLTGRKVNYTGSMFQLLDAELGFKPGRPTIPVFIATHSPQVLTLAGRLADGVLLANMGRREAVVNATRILREAEASSGRPRGSVAVHLRLETCISDDEEAALDVVRRRFAVRLVNSYPRWQYLDELGIEPTPALRAAAEAKDHAGVGAQLSAEDVRASTLVGSVDQVASHLASVLTPEVSKITIRPLAAAGENLSQTISRFVDDVWPRVVNHVGAAAPR